MREDVAQLDVARRWELVCLLIKKTGCKAAHFLHVPKTGGTTLCEALAERGSARVIYVDSDPLTFASHLKSACCAESQAPILTRAHHPHSVMEKVFSTGLIDLVFSSYRDPVSLHISNVNMIMRRMNLYFSTPSRLTEWETRFCTTWQGRFESDYENTDSFAKRLLLSDSYIRHMGSIYNKLFNTGEAVTSIAKKQIKIIYYKDLDSVFTNMTGDCAVPERRNVSDNTRVIESELSSEERARIIGNDDGILGLIRKFLVGPFDISAYFNR
jgi:hypothetical protein